MSNIAVHFDDYWVGLGRQYSYDKIESYLSYSSDYFEGECVQSALDEASNLHEVARSTWHRIADWERHNGAHEAGRNH